MGDPGLRLEASLSSGEGEASFTILDTRHGRLKLPAALYAIWEAKGWPEDHVLAAMAADGRWAP